MISGRLGKATTRTKEGWLTEAEVATLLQPRSVLVAETDGVTETLADGSSTTRFGLESGPYMSYERFVEILGVREKAGTYEGVQADGDGGVGDVGVGAGDEGDEGEGIHVRQRVESTMAIPYFGWLFRRASARATVRLHAPRRAPWWAPPDRLDAHSSVTLGCLAAIAIVTGFLNTLFTQTIAFAVDEFGASSSAEGFSGGVVRIGGLLALLLLSRSDRVGRRRMILQCAAIGCVLAATGSIAPSLFWLTVSQVLARGFASALIVLGGITAIEEMPKGSRAYAISLLAMSLGLGAGVCVIALNLTDLGIHGWRGIYVLPLLALPLVRSVARRLPETRRFEAHATDLATAVPPDRETIRRHRRRLILIATAGFLSNLFVAPASQFNNRFLTTERHYSGAKISLLSLSTGTPGGIGIILGGRLADLRGRRLVGGVALAGGTLLNVWFYFSGGWGLWVLGLVSSMILAASVPALAVYGPELVPTSMRGRANGIIVVCSLLGSAIGLSLAGHLADRFGRVGPGLAVLALGPLCHALLVFSLFPETAGVELEEINPEDATP